MAKVELPTIQVDEEAARKYVEEHGSPLERARLAGIFGAVGPERERVAELEQRQNGDGSFAPGGLRATAEMLGLLKELPPLAGSPMASRAVAYLRRMQQPDGAWADPVPGAGASAAAGEVDLTALVAYTVLTLEPEHVNPVARASAWLRSALSAEGAAGRTGALTLARAWAVWRRLLGERAHEPIWGLDQVLRRDLSSQELTGWLECALEAEAGGRLLVTLATHLARLAELQLPDGSWPGGVEGTLAALKVLRGFAVL